MLSGLFGPRTFLDPDVEQWHLDVWATLIERFGDNLSVADTPVALPTRDFSAALYMAELHAALRELDHATVEQMAWAMVDARSRRALMMGTALSVARALRARSTSATTMVSAFSASTRRWPRFSSTTPCRSSMS